MNRMAGIAVALLLTAGVGIPGADAAQEAPGKATPAKTSKGAPAAQPAVPKGVAEPDSALLSGSNVGEGESSTPSNRPWATGVSVADQQAALKFFREGNALLKESIFVQALNKYREALSHWDHPAIHYNMVLALLNLDQPIEVHAHLIKAMEYGPDPLDVEKYEQARTYKRLTEQQLAHVVIGCQAEGAQVLLDGRQLYVAPGSYEGYVRPGPHSIVARKTGYMNTEINDPLLPGQTSTFDLKLSLAQSEVEYRRLWPNWKPWSVLGAGLVVAAVGGGLHLMGAGNINDYDQAIVERSQQGAVHVVSELEDKRSSGERMQKIAIGAYALGGAVAITGAVLLYVNRLKPYTYERKVEPESQEETAPAAPPPVSVVPMMGPGGGGLMATFQF